MPAVWRLVTHWDQANAVVAWAKKEGRICIGWNPGDLRHYNSPRDISDAVREAHPGLHNWPYSGQQLWDFARYTAARSGHSEYGWQPHFGDGGYR